MGRGGAGVTHVVVRVCAPKIEEALRIGTHQRSGKVLPQIKSPRIASSSAFSSNKGAHVYQS